MTHTHLLALLLAATSLATPLAAEEAEWYTRKSLWNGFERFHFEVAGSQAYLVVPKTAAAGKPWVWRARFPGYHAEMDLMLVKRGFHIGYVDVAGMFGGPQAMEVGDAFYDFATKKRGLSRRVALEGVSRGGLLVYNWAARRPQRVTCIYCDTPVCDFKSWPGGRGAGLGSENAWKQCLAAYGFNEEQAASFRGNPIDHARVLAEAKIPMLHIVSENDRVVPPKENTYILQQRLEKLGHRLQLIKVAAGTTKSNGHHFDHPDPKRVVEFIVPNTVKTPQTKSD